MKHWLLGCLCVLLCGTAVAAPGAEDQPVVESSMLLTGTIVVAPDGSVRNHAIDRPEKVPSAIRAFADKAITAWKFVPVVIDGQPVTAQVQMHLRLIADPVEHGGYAIRIGGASFEGGAPNESVQADLDVNRRRAPQYPYDAMVAHAGGTVYLLLRIGRQGQVLDIAAEQVNLTVQGEAWEMTRLRREFSGASIAAAKQWRFIAPTAGPAENLPYWLARVPVTFIPSRTGRAPSEAAEYGRWQPYVRGPQEVVPWLQAPQLSADAADTTPDGSVLTLGQVPHLVTRVSGD